MPTYARDRKRKLEYGRIDYKSRSGQYEAIGYGPRQERIGMYESRDEAARALQTYVTEHHNQKGYGRPI